MGLHRPFLSLVHLMLCQKMSVFYVIFFKSFIIGPDHTVVGHQKSGNKSNTEHQ